MRRVLALHCSLASGAAWRPLLRHLPEVEAACPDLPGHGDAPWDRGKDYMDQALAGAVATRPEGAFDVIGHSFGACVALRLAVEAPRDIRSVVLVEPVMFAAADARARESNQAAMVPVSAALAQGDRSGAAEAFHGMWGGRTPWAALPGRAQAALAARIETIPAGAPAIADDVHGVLARLPPEMPVLLVTRAAPDGIVASIADGLADRIPGLARAEIGQGHMIPQDAPEALAAELRRFWNGLDAN